MTNTLDSIRSTNDHSHWGYTPDELARAILTTITEPGDPTISALLCTHGAESTLKTLIGETTDSESDEVVAVREKTLARAAGTDISHTIRAAHRYGATLITPNHPHWPTGLADLKDHAPHALWARGNTALLNQAPGIAIVGARAATGYGEHMTMQLTAGLVDHGRTIISGAAYGIDGMAHRAALASRGNTIAILAGGVDRFYPTGHDALLTRIVECGLVISEASCGQPPTKWRFLARNRLIAATTTATLVIEAGWRSGSLNTAGHALFLGRPVGAVPGPVTSAASAGCHRLIRDHGATLITTTDEANDL